MATRKAKADQPENNIDKFEIDVYDNGTAEMTLSDGTRFLFRTEPTMGDIEAIQEYELQMFDRKAPEFQGEDGAKKLKETLQNLSAEEKASLVKFQIVLICEQWGDKFKEVEVDPKTGVETIRPAFADREYKNLRTKDVRRVLAAIEMFQANMGDGD